MRKLLATVVTGLVCLGCAETTQTALFGSVAVSFSTQSPSGTPSAPQPSMLISDDTVITGSDTLVITSAQLVLREIELKAVEAAACDVEPEPPGCEEIEVGPVLVDLPLTSGAVQRFGIEIPPGMYAEIDFEVHKVSGGDPADATFLNMHPEFADKSIRVQGAFNGQAFLYETDLNVDQKLDLIPPLTVIESGDVNVTIRVDVGTWFLTAGGALVDPTTANKGGANEGLVKDNITTSLEAFEDDDRDGDEN